MAIKTPIRRKALLAIVFAGGMLNSQLPALSDNISTPSEPLIQRITKSSTYTPAARAYNLLQLASCYLASRDRAIAESQFTPTATTAWWDIDKIRNRESILIIWADRLSSNQELPTRHDINAKPEAPANSNSNAHENLVLADKAIQESLTQLGNSSDTFVKLSLYYIASQLFERVGDTDGIKKCDKVLQEAFQICANSSPVDEKAINAASAILNSMAYGLVPVNISDENDSAMSQIETAGRPTFTEKTFRQSEKLKLRALAMTDRLDTTNHLRRKAHRDLALWYTNLGKPEMAAKEKQALFELVGIQDDSILYPQPGSCGHLVWWQKHQRFFYAECGMG